VLVARGGWGIGDGSDWSDMYLKLRIEIHGGLGLLVLGSSRRGPVQSISTEARSQTVWTAKLSMHCIWREQAAVIPQTARPETTPIESSACLEEGKSLFLCFFLRPTRTFLDGRATRMYLVQRLAGR
jgi:hypothetical protein